MVIANRGNVLDHFKIRLKKVMQLKNEKMLATRMCKDEGKHRINNNPVVIIDEECSCVWLCVVVYNTLAHTNAGISFKNSAKP